VIPSFTEVILNFQSAQTIKRMKYQIHKARHTAITTNTVVTICKSSDLQDCGGSWNDGLLVFSDLNRNAAIDDQDIIHSAVNNPITKGNLYWRSFGNKAYLQFLPSGHTNNQNGTFTFCPTDKPAKDAKGFSITRTGRSQMAFDRNGDGIAENSSGTPLRC
jgi:type IV fimbrial biogenesis protein FimT